MNPIDTSLRKKIVLKLKKVYDPELNISIVDLGLVYDIQTQEKNVCVSMTLTTIGCPLFESIEEDIREKLLALNEIETVSLDIIFDPPWSLEMVSPEARIELGLE